jgi:hypothetical protein
MSNKIIKIPANSQAYLYAKRDANQDKFDVNKFVFGYLNTSAFPFGWWAYWKFEESSGPFMDSTGNEHHLINVNSEVVDYGATGIIGQCAIGQQIPDVNQGWLEHDGSGEVVTEDTPWSFVFWHKYSDGASPNNGDPLQITLPIYTDIGIYTTNPPSNGQASVYVNMGQGDEDLTYYETVLYDHTVWHMFTLTFVSGHYFTLDKRGIRTFWVGKRFHLGLCFVSTGRRTNLYELDRSGWNYERLGVHHKSNIPTLQLGRRLESVLKTKRSLIKIS